MKLFTRWVLSAGLVLTAGAANAQGLLQEIGNPRYTAVSDFSRPYAAMPPEAPAPGYAVVPGYGPTLLPPREVYTVVRENGFSPLGIPRQHGLYYTIAVIDRRGNDGRLVIDARTGQIVRFAPAYRLGDNANNANNYVATSYPRSGPLPPISNLTGPPRPPVAVPMVASRMPATVPTPKASPPRAGEVKPLVEKPAPEPVQQSAAVQAKPADTPAPRAEPPVVEAKPAAPSIQPTQQMPTVQGLE
jgi:hypothetical protein